MKELYDIVLAGKPIGIAKVSREGLYYVFCCVCRLSGDVLYRLSVQCGNETVNLGVCVPQKDGFGLKTRVPVKRLGEGELSFTALPKHQELKGCFVPIRSDEPFLHISKLQEAYLQIQEGQIGAVIGMKKDELTDR